MYEQIYKWDEYTSHLRSVRARYVAEVQIERNVVWNVQSEDHTHTSNENDCEKTIGHLSVLNCRAWTQWRRDIIDEGTHSVVPLARVDVFLLCHLLGKISCDDGRSNVACFVLSIVCQWHISPLSFSSVIATTGRCKNDASVAPVHDSIHSVIEVELISRNVHYAYSSRYCTIQQSNERA